MADTAGNGGTGQTGINIMIAGLSSQVASLIIFMGFCVDFAWRVRKSDRKGAVARTYEGLGKMGSSILWWEALVAGESSGSCSTLRDFVSSLLRRC